jgi:SAM-dependent methyltransferase
VADPVKIDIGCGTKKQADHIGVDRIGFPGVDVVMDVGKDRWPWNDGTVDEAYCSHLVEHLKPAERIHFVNELHRVLKPGGKAQIVAPHWCSCRAYGDLTHEWPPVSEFWFYYLAKEWRTANAPHNDAYTCDFQATWGYTLHPELMARNAEHQAYAVNHYKEMAQDIVATLTKR